MSSRKTADVRKVGSHPEVYPPCDDSFLLVDALLSDQSNLLTHSPSLVLEIGSGSGYVIASLALILGSGPQYLATDINPHALHATLETLISHGLEGSCKFDLIQTDVVLGLEERIRGKVDVLVVNPPYVPTPEEEVGREGIVAAWAGGENGRKVIDRVLEAAEKVLSDRGWLYMVVLAGNDPKEICVMMGKRGFRSRIVLRRSTEEEFLQVIKFWRDLSTEEGSGSGGVPGMGVLGSLAAPFSFLWESGSDRVVK